MAKREVMEDRIKIGDEWYVRENSLQTDVDTPLIDIDDITTYKSSVWEDENFCFEATHNLETGVLEMIVFTDKRNQKYPFTEQDCWDNEFWFKRVIDNDKGIFEEFDETDTLLINTIKVFINHAYNIFH